MSTDIVSKHVIKVPERLVAPIEKQNVPNHLLNTKIYAKLERNDLFEVTPVEVHFSGFEIGEDAKDVRKYTQKLRIINISDQVQRMTVLPPQTKYFDVFYVKPERLVPGFALEIQVIFKPDAYRYYTDAIRIHSKGEENLIVPLHAYPIISSFDFPTEYKFPHVAIGSSITRSFSIRSTAPIEFEFMIDILQKHPAFEVDPLEGVIPFNRDAVINVTFTPKEFCTAIMAIQLIVSQFNSKPIVCKFYGTCNPGLARDKVLTAINNVDNNVNEEFGINSVVDPRMLSPLHLSRLKRQYSDFKSELSASTSSKQNRQQRQQLHQAESVDGTIEIDGYRFPKELNTVWGVSKFLNQTKGKLRLRELKAQANATNQVSKQQKETLFLQKVIELEDEERRNQLKWQVKLGETSIDHQSKQEILISRAQAEHQYKLSIGQPVYDEELSRRSNLLRNCRTYRPYNQIGRSDMKFDVFKNELWSLRHLAANKFIEAARKIIIISRLKIVLNALKAFSSEWIHAKKADAGATIEGFVEQYEKKLKGENIEQDVAVTSLTSKTLGTFYFPKAVDSNDSQSDTERYCDKVSTTENLDSLGPVAVKPIEFSIQTETPYVSLAVPKYYRLNNYNLITDSQYVPKYDNRINKLRKGAEDELIQVDIKKAKKPVVEKKRATSEFMQESSVSLDVTAAKEPTSKLASVSPLSNDDDSSTTGLQIIDVEAPSYLSEPVQYPPMHIFNPAPGLVSYQKLLPYSGSELNHHLNPLPRFEKDHSFTAQKKYIDRDDVIKGIMSWKKFPSQGLISLSNTPTLTDVWVPRWSNVFGSDLVPIETPPLLAGLPADDKENLLLDNDDNIRASVSDVKKDETTAVSLTPEMVNAQFNIPSIFEKGQQNLKDEIQFPYSDKLPPTNLPASIDGPVPREQREQELEYFLNKQYNELGLRIKSKLSVIQSGAASSEVAAAVSGEMVLDQQQVGQETTTTQAEQQQQQQTENK